MFEVIDDRSNRANRLALALAPLSFIVYYFSNPLTGSYYDYTLRIAGALLEGRLGLEEPAPYWLNEMIPLNGLSYSAFPLGSVLTMLPLAILKKWGWIGSFPGVLVAALLAAVAGLLLFHLSESGQTSNRRRLSLVIFPIFGSWMWANLAFAGAWHLAQGFAVVGQLGALYFILVRPQPFLAGLFFALAFGNRTEIILLAPIFMFLIYRGAKHPGDGNRALISFATAPLALLVATLAYNYARFSSILDFGYAHIPGVLNEPWYRHGIFSIYAIPGNVEAMLLETWKRIDRFPYLVPTGFGGSIFLNSPYLVFLFRSGARDRTLKLLSWSAIGILTLVLWCHGNTGGWQISYRYAIELLPWMFLILRENSPNRIGFIEASLLIASVAINAYATYLFLWTDYIK